MGEVQHSFEAEQFRLQFPLDFEQLEALDTMKEMAMHQPLLEYFKRANPQGLEQMKKIFDFEGGKDRKANDPEGYFWAQFKTLRSKLDDGALYFARKAGQRKTYVQNLVEIKQQNGQGKEEFWYSLPPVPEQEIKV